MGGNNHIAHENIIGSMARKENTDVDNGVSENEIETYFIRGREFSTGNDIE